MADVKKLIKVEREQNGLAIVTFNRPKSMNSLSQAMIEYLAAIFKSLSEDVNVWVIILTGAGRAFCAGVVSCLLPLPLPLPLYFRLDDVYLVWLQLF